MFMKLDGKSLSNHCILCTLEGVHILTKESSVDTNVDSNRERAKVDYGFKTTTTTTTITFKNLTE